MHTMWKGSISFGLVHIPIKLFSATESKDVKLRMIHKECNSPIKYERTCPVCEKEVENNEIVKGYEYEPGKFVLLDGDELDAIAQEQNKSVEIIDFVKLEEIDPIYFNRSYFIGPNENGEKAYTLLKQAMEKSGKIGIAKITIRSKQHLAVVRVFKNALVLETIYFPDEVRNVDQVPGVPENVELNKKEMETAVQLIEQLTTTFEPEKYTDDYRTALMDLIQAKISGNEVQTAKEAPETNIVDLMDALQASIDQTKPKKRKTTRKKKATG
ncbi:Ku protein [Anaerobacillus arseniciselenatis]|uniref:Non-homologous end joining protein Ku n=1 Tax=Anaerobacillus arseniciselenatis TaxID=85682 RepID=A0A1S2LK45_9BACI|nr:Ku protein [Anaerobacillus arseniciselenatis]OIJ12746.1 Ku protein [Anaerobacillus arseniciselenatis]